MAQVGSTAEGLESFREEIEVGKSMINSISGIVSRLSSQFGGEQDVNAADEEDESLHWAAIEKLPSYKRMRVSILKEYGFDEDGGKLINRRVVDVGHLKPLERHLLIEKLITDTVRDNEKFLRKLKNRIDRVGVELPTVEVRYTNLNVDAQCHVGSRALPTLWNVTRNILEGGLEIMHLSPSKKAKFTILKDVSGLIKPSRHVYRENNMVADLASKEGLRLVLGRWKITETRDGTSQDYYHRPFIDMA